jgi:cobalt-zinc-cadmium efflux system membrane fusion protein
MQMSETNNKKTSVEWLEKPASVRRQIILIFILFSIAALLIVGVWMRVSKSAPTDTAAHKEEHAEEKENGEPGVITLDEEALEKIDLTLESAQYRTVSQTIPITGAVGPNQTRMAHMRPLARGRIEKVYVRAGDRVSAGQPLVAYDNIELGELVSEYATAKATLDKANAEAEVSRRAVERAQKLTQAGAVAMAEYEKRDAEYKSALASINVQKAQIAMIEQKLRRFGMAGADIEKLGAGPDKQRPDTTSTLLRSPFNGIVIKAEVAEGETVDTERELLTVADLSTVWVQGDVYEKDIASIRLGQGVKATLNAYPDRTFTGKLTYLSDVLDPQTRTAKVRCEMANPRGLLKLEMFATIQIPTGSSRKALMVPAAAVQQIDTESVVFVEIAENKFEKRKVEPGTNSDGWTELKSGLKAGEKVVAQGAFMLKSHLKKEEFGEDEH